MKVSSSKRLIRNYNEILQKLTELGLVRSSNALSEKTNSKRSTLEYTTKDSSVSNKLFDTALSSTELYTALHDEGQYNIEFKDGSLLLFQCTIEGRSVVKQRIVFLKPFRGYEQEESGDYEGWEAYQTDDLRHDKLSFPILIRVDFDANEKKGDHPLCHITLSNITDCRIPARANIDIGLFVEFILQQFFNINNISLPKMNSEDTIRENEKAYIHINWI